VLAPLAGPGVDDVAMDRSYLDDVALAGTTRSRSSLVLAVERHYARSFDAPLTLAGGGSPRALTVALDFRSDALLAWASGGELYAREVPASGAPGPVEPLAYVGADLGVAAQLSDDGRGIVAWSSQIAGVTSVYVDLSAPGVRFGRRPRLLERFRDPHGLPGGWASNTSPQLVRLRSESVMLAWAGSASGRWAVRAAAVDLRGPGTATTVSPPGADALLDGLAPAPDGGALAVWRQPSETSGGGLDLSSESILTAWGTDVHPDRTSFDGAELLAGPGSNGAPALAIDPASDRALAVWQGPGGDLLYSVRAG
jgi:hypothetical protein